jgi:hypothetical protein
MNSVGAFVLGAGAGALAMLGGLVILAAWMSRDDKYDPGREA